MEKLVMLLDIYEEEVVGVHSVGDKITEKDESWICSKKFGFIKWLVETDNIDHKIYEDIKFKELKYGALFDKKSGRTAQETREIIKDGCIDAFIALLAISDTPIQDLCVWLK